VNQVTIFGSPVAEVGPGGYSSDSDYRYLDERALNMEDTAPSFDFNVPDVMEEEAWEQEMGVEVPPNDLIQDTASHQ
jgi:hypothetical protein